jgi:hypothetical protein
VPLVFPFLAIFGSSLFAGVMLAVALILGAFWRSLPPAEFLAWFGANSYLVARTIPVVVVPTLIGLAGSLWLNWGDASARYVWLAALGCILALLALTVAYFLPINATFNAGSIPLEDVRPALDAWLAMHWLRIALAAAAATLGLVAVTR